MQTELTISLGLSTNGFTTVVFCCMMEKHGKSKQILKNSEKITKRLFQSLATAWAVIKFAYEYKPRASKSVGDGERFLYYFELSMPAKYDAKKLARIQMALSENPHAIEPGMEDEALKKYLTKLQVLIISRSDEEERLFMSMGCRTFDDLLEKYALDAVQMQKFVQKELPELNQIYD